MTYAALPLLLSFHPSMFFVWCCTGAWVNVMKDPVTDTGKRSKTGRVTLFHDKATGNNIPS